MIRILIFIVTIYSHFLFSQYSINGTVFEKGKKIKLSNIEIIVLPEKIKTRSDLSGNFKIDNILFYEYYIF